MEFMPNEEIGTNVTIQDDNPYQNDLHHLIPFESEAWIELHGPHSARRIFIMLLNALEVSKQLYTESKLADVVMPMDPVYMHTNFELKSDNACLELKCYYSLLDRNHFPIKLSMDNYGYTTTVKVTPKIIKELLKDIKISFEVKDFTIDDQVYWSRASYKIMSPLVNIISDDVEMHMNPTNIIMPQPKNNQGYMESFHRIVRAINQVGVTRKITQQLLGYKNLNDTDLIMDIFYLIEKLSFITNIIIPMRT